MIQKLLTEVALDPVRLNSVIENLKDGSKIKIANFQALIDDSYTHNNNWGDQKVETKVHAGEPEAGHLAQKQVNLRFNFASDHQPQKMSHIGEGMSGTPNDQARELANTPTND